MDECTSPFIESSSLMPEDLSVPDDPDIPASNEHHFGEEGLPKTPASIKNQMSHGVTRRPINLQIVPNSDTEVAIEEQMIPCSLVCKGQRTQFTPSSKCQCLLSTMSLVFNLSIISIQAKTLIFIVQEDFQIQAVKGLKDAETKVCE